MLWKGFILTAAISMSLIGTSSVVFARGCSSIPCRCAVQNGGSYNPATDRWSMAGCTGAQFQAFNDCVGRAAHRLQPCDPANRFGNCSVQANRNFRHPTKPLQPVSHGTPYINQGKLQTVTLDNPHFQPAPMRNRKALKPKRLDDVVR
jgi:hypothetical protein